MKTLKVVLAYISSCKIWLIALACANVLFIFFAWFAYPEEFYSLIWLMIFVSVGTSFIPLFILVKRHHKLQTVFHHFLTEPDEANEYALCEAAPISMHPFIHELGDNLRSRQAEIDNSGVQLVDYESYIENWVHEIKKPLSLMTLVLDNRKEELSPLVYSRMLHVRDHIRQDVEQILYFSRLGATHKDYYWEPLSVLTVCKEAISDNQTLLEEAGFTIDFWGHDCNVFSDKKGLMFILGQLINNSVKYADKTSSPTLLFQLRENIGEETIVLSITDNGPGIPNSDLLFVFEKGFTGDRGSYMSRSTGMGLYLVKKMATDLAIDLQITSELKCGTTVSLIFPKVKSSVRRCSDAANN